MNLECPKCGAANTRKMTLVMAESATQKGTRLGMAYMYNIWLPFITIGVGLLVALFCSLFAWQLALMGFGGTLFGGYILRKWIKGKFRSKYADLSADMKARGFQCDRCEYTFIPGTGTGTEARVQASQA